LELNNAGLAIHNTTRNIGIKKRIRVLLAEMDLQLRENKAYLNQIVDESEKKMELVSPNNYSCTQNIKDHSSLAPA